MLTQSAAQAATYSVDTLLSISSGRHRDGAVRELTDPCDWSDETLSPWEDLGWDWSTDELLAATGFCRDRFSGE